MGEMRIAQLGCKDIAKLHFDLRDKPYQANRTLGVLSKMLSLAEVWDLRPDGSNSCRHVKRYKENKRERFLSPEKTQRLGEVLREAESEMPSAVAPLRLLLLTGCRLSEIQLLRREHVKDDCIELPDAKTCVRVVPLRPEARAVLADLPVSTAIPGSSAASCQAPISPISSALGGASASVPTLMTCEFTAFATPMLRRRWLWERASRCSGSCSAIRRCRQPPDTFTSPGIPSKTPWPGSPGASAGSCRPFRASKKPPTLERALFPSRPRLASVGARRVSADFEQVGPQRTRRSLALFLDTSVANLLIRTEHNLLQCWNRYVFRHIKRTRPTVNVDIGTPINKFQL